jgi:hypothetical protein
VAILLLAASAGNALSGTTAAADDEKASERRTVSLRFVGFGKKLPLAKIKVVAMIGYGDEEKKFGPFETDDEGTVEVKLPPGFYHLYLSSDKELPYLPVEALWNGRQRASGPDLSLFVKETTAEKWLGGTRREAGEEPATGPATGPGGVPRVNYTLLPACELVLRAVDADTGEGLAGAEFYTENAVGEEWAHRIKGANLGAKIVRDKDDVPAKENLTDDKGNFRRFVGANGGYMYGVTRAPPGYEEADPEEVEIPIHWGKPHAEHVFKFRKIR